MPHIEFIGIPGAGKSVISNAVVKLLREYDYEKTLTCEEAFLTVSKIKMERIYRTILNIVPQYLSTIISQKLMNRSLMQYDAQNCFLANHGPSLAAYLTSKEFMDVTPEYKKHSISFFLTAGAVYETVKELFAENNVFFSEGFIQKSFMFLHPDISSNPSQSVLDNYFSHIPLPDILFYVRASPEVCFTRMRSRSKGVPLRLRHTSEIELIEFLNRADQYLNSIVEYLGNKYNLRTIVIDNSGSLDSAILQVKNFVVDSDTSSCFC